jgi:putative transposase
VIALGSKLSLSKVMKGKKKKTSPRQMRLPWDEWEPLTTEVQAVAKKFVLDNCYDLKVAAQLFENS